MQDQQFVIDGDHALTSRRKLVSPRVFSESLRTEAEPLPAHKMLGMLRVLTDRLEKLGVHRQFLVRLEGNRLGKCLRVFECHFEVHMSEVSAVETFGSTKGFRVRVPKKIQPGSVVESGSCNHECICFPVPDRIS